MPRLKPQPSAARRAGVSAPASSGPSVCLRPAAGCGGGSAGLGWAVTCLGLGWNNCTRARRLRRSAEGQPGRARSARGHPRTSVNACAPEAQAGDPPSVPSFGPRRLEWSHFARCQPRDGAWSRGRFSVRHMRGSRSPSSGPRLSPVERGRRHQARGVAHPSARCVVSPLDSSCPRCLALCPLTRSVAAVRSVTGVRTLGCPS